MSVATFITETTTTDHTSTDLVQEVPDNVSEVMLRNMQVKL